MGDQHLAIVEIEEEIFGPAAKCGDRSSGQPVGKAVRKRKTQILAPGLDRDQPAPLEGRGKSAADGLDFGQLGHG